MGKDQSPYDDPTLKGLQRYYNSQTQRGRANVAKFWLSFYATMYVAYKVKKRFFDGDGPKPEDGPNPEDWPKPTKEVPTSAKPPSFAKSLPGIKDKQIPPQHPESVDVPPLKEPPTREEEASSGEKPVPPPCAGEEEGEHRGEGAC